MCNIICLLRNLRFQVVCLFVPRSNCFEIDLMIIQSISSVKSLLKKNFNNLNFYKK